ncbi:hypothetical protein ABE426_18860 [Sphingobacterium faecium]|uniref:hypothetical protein n=1 Tax=Sphingobacterium faecium TaxID=34087 RepID=UPI003207FC15
MTVWQLVGVEQLSTSDFNQKVHALNDNTNSRLEVICLLKKQKRGAAKFKTNTTIVQATADNIIAKVTIEFDEFNKIDLIALVNDDGNWKVSLSIKSYKQLTVYSYV